eukprot:scaffold45360_cov26-Tisochrysis_lutea.AAC.3
MSAARAATPLSRSGASPSAICERPSSCRSGQCARSSPSSAVSMGSLLEPLAPSWVLMLSSPVGAPPNLRLVSGRRGADARACKRAVEKAARSPHAPSGSNAVAPVSPRLGLSLRSMDSISVPASARASTMPARGPSWSERRRRERESPLRSAASRATELRKCLMPSGVGGSLLSRQRPAYSSLAMAARLSERSGAPRDIGGQRRKGKG